jgi:peptidyl-prolyl cis-trans isomerase SurA
MRSVLLALALGLLAAPLAPAARAQGVVERIAAVVNQNIITTQDLLNRIDLAIISSGLPNTPETRQRLAPQVLRGFIDETLEGQEASRLKLEALPTEVDRAFASIAERNHMTADQLGSYLEGKGLAPSILRNQLKGQIDWLKVVTRELRPKVVVTREQVDLALKSEAAGDEEIHLGEIVLPVYSPDQEASVMKDADNLVASIRNGGDFAALARQLSAAQTASQGGDLGWVRLSSLIPQLRAVVATMPPGTVTSPIRTQNGIYVFQMRDRRLAPERPVTQITDAEREQTRKRLEEEQLQRLATRYLRDLRRSAFIDVRM